MSEVDACRRLSMGTPAKKGLRRSSRQRLQEEEKKENEAELNDEQGRMTLSDDEIVSDTVPSDDDETVSDADDSGDDVVESKAPAQTKLATKKLPAPPPRKSKPSKVRDAHSYNGLVQHESNS
jgi:hypothetical protein